jgi:GR25 family glycosyltransferase involved in LPS biosynthesis
MIKKIFICHYTKLIDRKASMINQLQNIPISHLFIEKYDQEEITEQIYTENFDETKQTKLTKNVFVREGSPEMVKTLNRGELSIALKQKEALKLICEDSNQIDDEHYLILEDDIRFKKSINKIDETLNYLKNNNIKYDIIFFGEAGLLKDRDDEFLIQKQHPATNGLCTYVITAKAAKILFDDLNNEKISFPIDHEYNYRFYKNKFSVFWATPLTKHGSVDGTFKSTLR